MMNSYYYVRITTWMKVECWNARLSGSRKPLYSLWSLYGFRQGQVSRLDLNWARGHGGGVWKAFLALEGSPALGWAQTVTKTLNSNSLWLEIYSHFLAPISSGGACILHQSQLCLHLSSAALWWPDGKATVWGAFTTTQCFMWSPV